MCMCGSLCVCERVCEFVIVCVCVSEYLWEVWGYMSIICVSGGGMGVSVCIFVYMCACVCIESNGFFNSFWTVTITADD